MKIKVPRLNPTMDEVEISLPLYRYHNVSADYGRSERFTKFYAGHDGLRALTLHRIEPAEWQITDERVSPHPHPKEDADYILGQGEYALTAEKWESVRAQCEAWLRQHGIVQEKRT